MHTSATAYDLMGQVVQELDLFLLSEQYRDRNSPSWYAISGAAAIWSRDTINLRVRAHRRGDGFVWIRCAKVTFFSLYLTTNESMSAFQNRLAALEYGIRNGEERVLAGGDFNAGTHE